MILSPEELAIVQSHRNEKAKQETERLKFAEKAKRGLTLEADFKQAVADANREIDKYIEKADHEIDQAVRISEQYGIPFSLNTTGMPSSRQYTPTSFTKMWGDVGRKSLDAAYISNCREDGWEYWNSSSLSC